MNDTLQKRYDAETEKLLRFAEAQIERACERRPEPTAERARGERTTTVHFRVVK